MWSLIEEHAFDVVADGILWLMNRNRMEKGLMSWESFASNCKNLHEERRASMHILNPYPGCLSVRHDQKVDI